MERIFARTRWASATRSVSNCSNWRSFWFACRVASNGPASSEMAYFAESAPMRSTSLATRSERPRKSSHNFFLLSSRRDISRSTSSVVGALPSFNSSPMVAANACAASTACANSSAIFNFTSSNRANSLVASSNCSNTGPPSGNLHSALTSRARLLAFSFTEATSPRFLSKKAFSASNKGNATASSFVSMSSTRSAVSSAERPSMAHACATPSNKLSTGRRAMRTASL
mmetsp:Transcript_55455/g.160709  ORF Transcript_55455/g.160709 Transcript_55455/m.160709 type:complete len:228 (-) Transcript_55455:168-851(-)